MFQNRFNDCLFLINGLNTYKITTRIIGFFATCRGFKRLIIGRTNNKSSPITGNNLRNFSHLFFHFSKFRLPENSNCFRQPFFVYLIKLQARQTSCIMCNHQFFICWNDNGCHWTIFGCDIASITKTSCCVAFFINIQAQELAIIQYFAANHI